MSIHPDYFGTSLKKTAALFKKEKTIDEETFKQLIKPLKENMYNFIYKALNFSEDADDVYQETVLRAFKYRNSYNRKNIFKTWIFTIANNEIKSYFKKNKKLQNTVDLEEHLHIIYDTGNEELVRAIYDMAQNLNPKQRRVFFLFYDHGFSIREIGEITRLKEGNIKFMLNQSREKIKEKMKN